MNAPTNQAAAPPTGGPHDRLTRLRSHLMTVGLAENQAPADPLELLRDWLTAAFDAGLYNAHAMALCTVNSAANPSVRNVLARHIGEPPAQAGVGFYTDETSRKGAELLKNPSAAGLFSWLPLERQVRVAGPTFRLDETAADAYFAARPPEAQVAMLASQQSAPVDSRDQLVDRFNSVVLELDGVTPARPGRWCGYCLVPNRVEFWQGRTDRIHDRLVYERSEPVSGDQGAPTGSAGGNGAAWSLVRLEP